MIPNRVAAALASMLLILTVAAIVTINKSTGFLIDIATAPESCPDDVRIVIVTLHNNHTVQLNCCTTLEMAALRPKVRELFKNRVERVLFVQADPDVPFQQFVDLIDAVRQEVHIVSLITPQVEEQVRARHCLSPGCGACTVRKPWFTGVRIGE
ncbi:MAG: biopolymer transporter ExbD [Acidobacteria bacterium]|nr:biopolymer transporter ExbD [Acidobacteriota bacterium]